MIKELAVLASSAVIAVNSANYDNRFYNLSNPPEINMVQQSGSAKPDNKNKPPSLLEKSCSDLSIEKIKRVKVKKAEKEPAHERHPKEIKEKKPRRSFKEWWRAKFKKEK